MIGPGFSIDRHWSRVRDAFTENYKNDILWLITLRGTKTRDSLFNWECISSPICASCNRRETIDHNGQRTQDGLIDLFTMVLLFEAPNHPRMCRYRLKSALAGNRTRASRVAGENSTTEPPVPV